MRWLQEGTINTVQKYKSCMLKRVPSTRYQQSQAPFLHLRQRLACSMRPLSLWS
jgi:hypothetical protein